MGFSSTKSLEDLRFQRFINQICRYSIIGVNNIIEIK